MSEKILFDNILGRLREKKESDDSIRFDEPQNLTDEQRITALANVSNQTANTNTGRMGYKVLMPGVPFASQVTEPNTIYEIRDVFDLGGTEENPVTVNIPAGVVLKNNGGLLKNCTVELAPTGTSVESSTPIFGEGVTITGKPLQDASPEWFTGSDADKIERAVYAFNSIKLAPRDYHIYRPIILSTSFRIEGSAIPDFFGRYSSINNNSYSASRIIGYGDIPCIIRVCQRDAKYVSAVIRGVDFRNATSRTINAINWATPGGPSRPVEISNCNFRGVKYGLYIYTQLRMSSVTFKGDSDYEFRYSTGSYGDDFAVSAAYSESNNKKYIDLTITPKETFIDTNSEIASMQSLFDNTAIEGLQNKTLGDLVTIVDIFGCMKENVEQTIASSSTTNIDCLSINSCNFSSNKWGLYIDGTHSVMNGTFENNNAENNLQGAIYSSSKAIFASFIVRNNLIEGQPQPLELRGEQSLIEVSSNYLESSVSQTIIVADSTSNGCGKIVIKDNLTSTGASNVFWNISFGTTNYDKKLFFSNVGRPQASTVFLQRAFIKDAFLGKKLFYTCMFDRNFPFSKLDYNEGDVYYNVGPVTQSHNFILDKDLPIAFKSIGTSYDTYLSSVNRSITAGIWRLCLWVYNVSSSSAIRLRSYLSGRYETLISGSTIQTTDRVSLLCCDFEVSEDFNKRIEFAAKAGASDALFISPVFLYKISTIENDGVFKTNDSDLKIIPFSETSFYLPANKDTLSNIAEGFVFYDSNLAKNIMWDGTNWVNIDKSPLITNTITNALTNISSNNAATSIDANKTYIATLTADTGYELGTVSVTMGGTDITAQVFEESTGVIYIASVTGNIVITATSNATAE